MEIIFVLGLISCGILWYAYRGLHAEQKEARRRWLAESILTEAEGVVMDFLDYGKEVSQATQGKYQGMVSARLHQVYKSGEMGFYITMYDSGDLSSMEVDTLSAFHLESFVKKYGYYYDGEREAVVYITSRGVKLQPGEKKELEAQLLRRIRNHPLAVIKPDVICTRGI